MDKFKTKPTSNKTMDIKSIILRETKTTRLLFCASWVDPALTDNPLRGGFRFQKKSPIEIWEDFDAKKISTLKKDEEYNLNLNGDDITILFKNLEEIKQTLLKHGHSYRIREFTVSDKNAGDLLLQISNAKNRELIKKQLKKLESDNFQSLGSVIGSARIEKVIEEFEKNIENSDEDFWQKFFENENNTWILQQLFSYPVTYLNGETYLGGKNSKGRQGQGGVATDYLLKNGSNGSFAVVEIKTPITKLIGSLYKKTQEVEDGSNEIYGIYQDTTAAIVQMENQIYIATEYFKDLIGKDFNINFLDPRGVLMVGNFSKLSDSEKKSFNLFRKTMGKNQIITFDEVLEKLKLLKVVYES
jgi:hypothetical protein